MPIPKFLQSYFASYDLSNLDIKRDKRLIVTQTLNLGDPHALRWLFASYNLKEIKEIVRNPSRGMWFERSLNYWRKILDTKISKHKFETAIINWHPRLDVYKEVFP